MTTETQSPAAVATETQTATTRLAEWAHALTLDDIPETVRQVAREHILDTLGCGIAACAVGEGTAGLQLALDSADEQVGSVSLIGSSSRSSTAAAALANAMLCHGLDFDDTHEQAIAHISTVVVPAAIATGESIGANGEDVLTAIIVGMETVARLGMGSPNGFHARGFHPTGVCGIFGAVLATCKLRGATVEQTVMAMGLAGSMASGIFAYLNDGSPTKPLHAGWAAHAAVEATGLALAGARGPRAVLEGRFGLFETHVDSEWDIESQLETLGDRWEASAIAIKPYPACHWTHAGVDAVVEASAGATADEISQLIVEIPDAGVPIVLEPVAHKRSPATAYDAKFSLSWCIAARLINGRLDVRSFTEENLADEQILALAARVEHRPWSGEPVESPFAGAAIVTAGGTTREVRFDSPRGSSARPMQYEEVVEKFTANASLGLDESEIKALIAAVDRLQDGPNLEQLTAPLRRANLAAN